MVLDKFLRIGEGKILRKLQAIARRRSTRIEDDFVAMTDAELQAQTDGLPRSAWRPARPSTT